MLTLATGIGSTRSNRVNESVGGTALKQITEALGVAIAVNAGPTLVYAARVIDAYPARQHNDLGVEQGDRHECYADSRRGADAALPDGEAPRDR